MLRLASLLGLSALGLASPLKSARQAAANSSNTVTVSFNPGVDTTGAAVLPRALGALSIEFCYIIDYLGDVNAKNTLSYQLLQNIQDLTGAPPIIRIGGHTQDVAQYHPDQTTTLVNVFQPGNDEAVSVSFNNGLFTAMNKNVPSEQQFVFGLNLGQNNVSYPLAEVAGAESHVKPKRITSYELGNEPDFYNVQRPNGWNLGIFVAQQKDWISQINPEITHPKKHGWQLAAFAQEPIYMGNFSLAGITALGLPEAAGNVKTMSDHTYPFSVCSASSAAEVSLPILMNHTHTLEYFAQWAPEIAAARSVGAEFVMGETGSVSCHGEDGVSNTLGAALWEIDYMLHGAVLGMSGVYFHMGTPFFYSMWQPIAHNGTAARVYPTYYSLLFIGSLLQNANSPVIYELSALENENLALYAIYDGGVLCQIVALNMQYIPAATSPRPSVTLDVSAYFDGDVSVSLLTGPSSAETDSEQVTWRGQSYSTGSPSGYGSPPQNYAANSIVLGASEAVIIQAA